MTVEVEKMDELEFRRTIYADPNCNDPRVIKAAAEDQSKQDFWNELKQLDKRIGKASKISVPNDLAHKLILRQSMHRHSKTKQRNRIQLALAASIVFVFGISFTLWQQQNHLNMSEHALAHLYHEGDYALGAEENISLQQVNAKLARYGGELSEDIGRIYYANYCNFENVHSLHMVMQGKTGKVTVFIMPDTESYALDGKFKDNKYIGESFDFNRASIVILGEQDTDVKAVKGKLKKQLLFSA